VPVVVFDPASGSALGASNSQGLPKIGPPCGNFASSQSFN